MSRVEIWLGNRDDNPHIFINEGKGKDFVYVTPDRTRQNTTFRGISSAFVCTFDDLHKALRLLQQEKQL